MNTSGFPRLDSFPYRHRVAEVMSAPPVTAAPETPLIVAARIMADRGIGSLVALNQQGRPVGIATERDVLRTLARDGAEVSARSFGDIMSSPVATVSSGSLLHVAIARMARLGIRHLPVIDSQGGCVGLVAAGALLRLRANTALVLGDEVAEASESRALARAICTLPSLARGLAADGVPARGIAQVISSVLRDTTARSAELAEAEMVAAGHGPPPAPYAVLVLGSAGRGESLLVPDQDNALIHAGGGESWFANLGVRMTRILDEAGIPYCKGKVMASEPAWRGSPADWKVRVGEWVMRARPQDLLNVDIFFDAVPVHGEAALADRLREDAVGAAAQAVPFLKLLYANVANMGSALGLFGTIRSEGGWIDLKRHGLFPITAGARLLALAAGYDGTATPDRLRAAVAAGRLAPADANALDEAHDDLMGLLLDQQLADAAAGGTPGNRVALARLDRRARNRLRTALRAVALVGPAVGDSLLKT
jgi:signal-transduction protein with cAMP-binding, CBS, and nucleotidyltransferase domain